MKQLINANSLAEMLSISLASVRRYTSMGLMPCVHITPRTVRYATDEVHRFIEQRSYNMKDVAEFVKKEKQYPYAYTCKVSPPLFYIFVSGDDGFSEKRKYHVLSVEEREKKFVLITFDDNERIREVAFKDVKFAGYIKGGKMKKEIICVDCYRRTKDKYKQLGNDEIIGVIEIKVVVGYAKKDFNCNLCNREISKTEKCVARSLMKPRGKEYYPWENKYINRRRNNDE